MLDGVVLEQPVGHCYLLRAGLQQGGLFRAGNHAEIDIALKTLLSGGGLDDVVVAVCSCQSNLGTDEAGAYCRKVFFLGDPVRNRRKRFVAHINGKRQFKLLHRSGVC